MGMRWQDWMNALLGLWLIAVPLLMGYDQGYAGIAAKNSYLSGIGLIVLALLGLLARLAWREWLVLALGAWLIVSPFALDFADEPLAMWNTAITGIVVFIATVARLRARGKGPVGA